MNVTNTATPSGEKEAGFQAVFLDYLDRLESRAHASGMTLTDLCKAAKVSRATPDRWRKSLPKTIQNVVDLETAVERAERKR